MKPPPSTSSSSSVTSSTVRMWPPRWMVPLRCMGALSVGRATGGWCFGVGAYSPMGEVPGVGVAAGTGLGAGDPVVDDPGTTGGGVDGPAG
jgi:hypothetical protein